MGTDNLIEKTFNNSEACSRAIARSFILHETLTLTAETLQYSGSLPVTVGAWQLQCMRAGELQWELGSYSGSSAVTVGARQLQWELGNYSGNLAVTVGARQLQWKPGSYSGSSAVTVGAW